MHLNARMEFPIGLDLMEPDRCTYYIYIYIHTHMCICVYIYTYNDNNDINDNDNNNNNNTIDMLLSYMFIRSEPLQAACQRGGARAARGGPALLVLL